MPPRKLRLTPDARSSYLRSLMRNTLTKFSFVAVSALLFVGGFLSSSFAGPERMESKDKMVMAPPPECDPRWYISVGGSVDPDLGSNFSDGNHEVFTATSGVTATADIAS